MTGGREERKQERSEEGEIMRDEKGVKCGTLKAKGKLSEVVINKGVNTIMGLVCTNFLYKISFNGF